MDQNLEEENNEILEDLPELEDPEDIFLNYRYCYLCNDSILTGEYLYHLINEHPITMTMMYSLYFPETSVDENYQFLINTAINSMMDNMDYGSLQDLCDTIGYHKVGIEDINTIGKVIEKKYICKEDTCPICIDLLHEKDTIYTMNVCKHAYCKECIEKWVSENKTCPICKADLQILSTSTEPSDSSSESSLDKTVAPPTSPSESPSANTTYESS